MPKSLRFRLVLWVAAILCAIQVVLGTAFYLLTSQWLEGQLDNSLSATATQVVTTLQGGDFIDNGQLNFQFADEPANAFLRERQFFIRVIDQRQGNIIEASAQYNVAITPQALAKIPGYETLPIQETHSLMRVYTLPLEDEHFALQVGVSLAEVNATQTQITRMMAGALLFTLVLGSGSGLFLANRALIPIQAITRIAQQISEHDLTQRITLNSFDDELGQLARTFNIMLDRIERAFQKQQQFTADAAHELRTPLAIMQTGVEVILAQERSPMQYRATLETVQEEVQRLTTLTGNLLMLARADAHTLPLDRHRMDLSLLLNTVADQMTLAADQKQIRIQRDIPPDININADEDRLIQVALNLLENAVKYTPYGGSMTIKLSHSPHQVCFSIIDTGSGISPEHLSHIFDRFYRADRARTRHQGGVGLGLAIAQHIVQLHGGNIKVVSQLGIGSEFTVTLPTS